jgi:hypothetical protein
MAHSRSAAASHSRERVEWGSAISAAVRAEFRKRPAPARGATHSGSVCSYPSGELASVPGNELRMSGGGRQAVRCPEAYV